MQIEQIEGNFYWPIIVLRCVVEPYKYPYIYGSRNIYRIGFYLFIYFLRQIQHQILITIFIILMRSFRYIYNAQYNVWFFFYSDNFDCLCVLLNI